MGAQAAANGHRAPVSGASAPQAAASSAAATAPASAAAPAVAPTVAAEPATAAGAMDTAIPSSGPVADATDAQKRHADAQLAEPSAKRAKAEANGAQTALPAAAIVQDKPDWLGEPDTVAKFTFQLADNMPQASSVQMLRDSFGGAKAGVRNFDYRAVSFCKLPLTSCTFFHLSLSLPSACSANASSQQWSLAQMYWSGLASMSSLRSSMCLSARCNFLPCI